MLRKLLKRPNERFISVLSQVWSGSQGQNKIYSSQQLIDVLKTTFPKATTLNVEDVSGGCGAMFEIVVHDNKFKGISIIKQHRMITEALKDEIKDMHGIRIHTSIPPEKN